VSIRYPSTSLRLFCLPHAGGNTMHFHGWAGWLPATVEVVPVDLPGHGTRLREPLKDGWQPLIDDLVDLVARRIDGPYALFGHSLGALAAYDVARSLTERREPPELLLVAGRNAPGAPATHRPIRDLPDDQFLDALIRLGGTSAAIRHQPELLEMYLPLLRTDIRLAECYTSRPGAVLPCPLVAFAGRRDRMTDPAGVLAWHRETRATFELVLMDAGHFFLGDPEFTGACGALVAQVLAGRTDPTGVGQRP